MDRPGGIISCGSAASIDSTTRETVSAPFDFKRPELLLAFPEFNHEQVQFPVFRLGSYIE